MSRSERTKRNFQILLVALVVMLFGEGMPAIALEAIPHPGYLSGSIVVGNRQLTDVTIRAIDIQTGYSVSVMVTVPEGIPSTSYELSVEGDRTYHVIAEAGIIDTERISEEFSKQEFVYVPIYVNPEDEVQLDLFLELSSVSESMPSESVPATVTSETEVLNPLGGSSMIMGLTSTALEEDPNFAIEVFPSSQIVNPGGATVFFVSLTSLGGFDSEVSLSVSGLPDGVTASFNPDTVIPTDNSMLTISTDSEIPIGTYTMTIWCDGAGLVRSADINLTVNDGLVPMIYGTFSGQITDFETGDPIEGAKVFVDNDSYAYLYHYRYSNGNESRSGHNIEATTDSNGFYTLTGVSLGNNNTPKKILVGFYAEGYSLTFSNPTAVGEAIMPVDMELGHSTVTGKVTGASTGLPIEGATIYTYSYVYGSNGRAYSYLYATTDANGVYLLPNMPLHLDNGPRTYSTFQVSAPGYPIQNQSVTVTEGTTLTVDFDFSYGTFSGQITDINTGLAIAGAKVFVDTDSSKSYEYRRYADGREYIYGNSIEATTDSNGYYTLTGVPLGTNNTPMDVMVGLYAEGYSPTYTTATSVGDVITEVDMALGHSGVTGRVTDTSTGLPIEGATIYAYTYTYTYLSGSYNYIYSRLYATTDTNGVYSLPNMPLHLDNGPRTYSTFQASATGYPTQNQSVTVTEGSTLTIDFDLMMIYGTFTGQITDFETGTPIEGAKVFVDNDSYAYLYHYRYANGSESRSGHNIEATTDSNGFYTLTGVSLGNNNTPKEVLVGFYAEGYSLTLTNATAVADVCTVDMALGHSRVTGCVADASTDLPIEGATIYAESYATAYGSSGYMGYALSRLYATTDEDGDYLLPNMALHLDNGPRDYPTFQASAPGYYTQNKPITVVLGGRTVRNFGSLYDTPVGTGVIVEVTDPNAEEGEPNTVQITFEEVTEPGNTTVTFATTGPAVETGFHLGDPPTWFDITTTAVYEPNITVCLSYVGVVYQHEDNLKLMHKTDTGWEDVTTCVDTENKIICGKVTNLSWIAIVEPAPIANAGTDQIVEQENYDGTEVTLDGSSSKDHDSTPGTDDDIVSFDWFEADTFLGSGETITYTFPLGTHIVTLVVTDGYGVTDDDEVSINVQDTTPPVVDAGSNITVELQTLEGTEVAMNGSAIDKCDAELDYEWSENGVVLGNNANLTHTFSLGTHVLTLKAMDDSGNFGTDTVTVTVVEDTTPPDITCPNDVILECPADTSVEANGSATATDNYDDAPVITYSDSISGSCPMIITRTWTATDLFGNTSSCQQILTIVDTTAPAISNLNANYPLVAVGQTVTFSADVLDNCDSDIDMMWDFDDGTELSSEPNHAYEQPSIYTVTVTATDDCNNVTTDSIIVVVYDPAAGFTTGGGWFVPDSDSFIDGVAVTDTISKANFGFIVKYKKGADNPDGNLEFQYKAGDIDLKSQDMEWLVVQSDTKVRFKGKATINGEGLYTFKVTAEDNGEPGTGDWFKIEIWLGVVDTENGPPTPKHKAQGFLGGGNIQIHQT